MGISVKYCEVYCREGEAGSAANYKVAVQANESAQRAGLGGYRALSSDFFYYWKTTWCVFVHINNIADTTDIDKKCATGFKYIAAGKNSSSPINTFLSFSADKQLSSVNDF